MAAFSHFTLDHIFRSKRIVLSQFKSKSIIYQKYNSVSAERSLSCFFR